MKCSTGRTSTWTAALLSLFLVFVLPACWSGALTRAWLEQGQGPSNSNTNEEREEREVKEEHEVTRVSTRPRPDPRYIDAAPRITVVHHTPTIVASVAPKRHPSLFSERRLR